MGTNERDGSAPAPGKVSLTHFGAAGWSITDGNTVFLLDPYLSRIRFQGRKYGPTDATEVPNDPRPIVKFNEGPAIDREAVDRHVPCVDGSVLARVFLSDIALLVGAAMCSAC